ncbi:hypothetical protein IWX47DRAFT_880107 [Phyllosticta citricarpa]
MDDFFGTCLSVARRPVCHSTTQIAGACAAIPRMTCRGASLSPSHSVPVPGTLLSSATHVLPVSGTTHWYLGHGSDMAAATDRLLTGAVPGRAGTPHGARHPSTTRPLLGLGFRSGSLKPKVSSAHPWLHLPFFLCVFFFFLFPSFSILRLPSVRPSVFP